MEGILVTNVVATGLGRLCPCLIYGRQPLHSYIKIFHCRHPCLSNMIYLRNESIRCEALSVLISHHARLKYLCHSFFWRNESFMQTYNAGIPGQKWHLQSTMQWFDITPKTVDQSWNQVSFSCQFGQNDAFLIGTKRWVFYGKDWIGMRVSDRPWRWSIFQSDGMVNVFFFSGHHWLQWFFDGFDNVGPSPLNVFLRAQPLVSMVFRWFSKFWGQWSTMVLRLTMVWMYHWTLKVHKINLRQNTNFDQNT